MPWDSAAAATPGAVSTAASAPPPTLAPIKAARRLRLRSVMVIDSLRGFKFRRKRLPGRSVFVPPGSQVGGGWVLLVGVLEVGGAEGAVGQAQGEVLAVLLDALDVFRTYVQSLDIQGACS